MVGFFGSGWLVTFVGPVVAGGLLAFLASFGVVYSQTSAPSTNPADKAILTYGTN
ncbi:hypothetical protein GCM10009795_015140 [Nocardioides hankookensis]